MEKIEFDLDGEKKEFYVLESTTLSGHEYILVAESEDEDSEAFILREEGSDTGMAVYSEIEDDVELSAVADVFEKLLDDTTLERRF